MLRILGLLGIAAVVSGEYFFRSGTTPTTLPPRYAPQPPVNNRVAVQPPAPAPAKTSPSVLPPPPPNFVHDSFSHNISFQITAEKLPSKALDTIDPYFKVYETSKTIIEPVKIGQTEVIDDAPNAEFANVIWFNWKRGSNQTLKFKLKDSDRLHDNDISEAVLDADTFAAKGFKANLSLSTGGTILVQKTTPIRFTLYARNLPHKDLFGGKSDPFVRCYWRRGAKGQERKFHQTKTINDVENPDWSEVIEFSNYIKGTDLWLVFKVRDADDAGEDDLGDTMLELDPYVETRRTKIMRLGTQGQSTLAITPV